MRCPSCGAEQPDTELVCMECHNYLNLSEEELDRVERYRLSTHTELLCVMFCDVSGFTTVANASLSESQRILALHAAIVQPLIERDQSGEIVNTAGDGILIVFANPATAVECALRIHEAVFRYYQGILQDADVLAAIQARGLKRTPGAHDMQHRVHIGLHLGIVTRGGRTSRDVFGHNVNIACRLCDLGGPGQTYMSPPVYDNARLIIGDNEELQWQSWDELPIRGIATPMTVWGVTQRPINHLTSPRGMAASKRAPRVRVSLALAAVGLLAAVVVGGLAGSMLIRGKAKAPAGVIAPTPNTGRMSAAPAQADAPLPPVIALVVNPGDDDAPMDPGDGAIAPPTPTPADETPAPPADPNAGGSATTQPPMPQPERVVPAPSEETAPPPASDPEIKRYFSLLLKYRKIIEYGDGVRKHNGTLTVIRGASSLLIAVGVDEQAAKDARMVITFDGNNDGKLQSEAESPYLDLQVSAAGPGAEGGKPVVMPLNDGAPGDPLPAIAAVVGRPVHHGTGTVWIFRMPYDELGTGFGMTVKFRLEYTPTPADGALYHPPSPDGATLRDILIPEGK